MTGVAEFSVERAKRTGRCPHCDVGVAVVPDPPCRPVGGRKVWF